ncbi:hypothetical protein PPROV_000848800 [Pycnococcus provasolii]|uniref:Uncharacterized protein n=1 Tax=Pycnococcus provasolii TaxID=41880 RepID=A0A830HSV9_9CHLO|nr:hypothetical protein PPROV_000848800 [Pycnococcus provasolii]
MAGVMVAAATHTVLTEPTQLQLNNNLASQQQPQLPTMAGAGAAMQAAAAMLQFSAPTQQNTQNINPLDPSNDVIFVVSYNSDSSHLMIDDPRQPAHNQNNNNSQYSSIQTRGFHELGSQGEYLMMHGNVIKHTSTPQVHLRDALINHASAADPALATAMCLMVYTVVVPTVASSALGLETVLPLLAARLAVCTRDAPVPPCARLTRDAPPSASRSSAAVTTVRRVALVDLTMLNAMRSAPDV